MGKMAHDDRKTHLGIGRNLAACVAGGDTSEVEAWGHWLTKDREDVDCRRCIEWMHA